MIHPRYLIGGTRAVIAQLSEGSIDLVPATPPFRLPSPYLCAGHRRKQLGWAFKGGWGR